MKFVPVKVSRSFARSLLKTKKNSPHIFFGAGMMGIVGATVLACRATLKLEQTVNEIQKDLDQLPAKPDPQITTPGSDYTEREYVQDLGYVYIRAAVKVGKLYGPAIVVGGLSIAALSGSHIQLTRRNTALTVTLAAVSKAYEEYRNRIREELGAERELEIYRGYADDDVEVEGHRTDVVKTNPSKYSVYAKIFDEYNINWSKDPEINRIFLQCQQQYMNHMLHTRGHVLLNDVYDSIGVDRTKAGMVVGWVLDGDGDGYIDFGLFDESASRFINNYERSIVLDFNVDGVIYDMIKES